MRLDHDSSARAPDSDPLSPDSTAAARILVVEDDRAARAGLVRLLQECGYVVGGVADGRAALTDLETEPADLIVSDVRMPGVDGFELVAELRRVTAWRGIPVILMSCLDDNAHRVAGLDVGADDYVAKPLNFEELLARIRAQLRRARHERELLEMSLTDELTGLLNRRGILDVLAREQHRAERRGSAVSVVMLDIDGLKTVNDRDGHAVGDEMLREAAHALNEVVRASDRVGRLGGDEFLIVLPDADHEAAVVVLKRLQALTAVRTSISAQGPPRMSFGITTLEPGDTTGAMLERADEAMYRHKRRPQAC